MSQHFVAPGQLFYDPTDALVEMLDHLSPLRRKELLEEARPEPHKIKIEFNLHKQMPKGHTLADEFDHRKLEVECNGGFAEIDALPPLKRQLTEDSEMRVDFDDHQRIVKIVKKREAEFLQGEEHAFIMTSEGQRIPLNDETSRQTNSESEDVFDREDVELVTVEQEWTPPKDRWDLLFDATALIQRVRASAEKLQQMKPAKRAWVLQQMAKDLLYSADFFPYHTLRTHVRNDVRHLQHLIQTGTVSRASLFVLCQPPSLKEFEEAQVVFHQAQRASLGSRERLTLALRAKDLQAKAFYHHSRKTTQVARRLEREEGLLRAARQELHQTKDEGEKNLLKEEIRQTEEIIRKITYWFREKVRKDEGQYSDEMCISHKRDLWELLTNTHIERTGEARISKARFKKLYHGVLQRRHWKAFIERMEATPNLTKKEQDERVKLFKRTLWKEVEKRASKIYQSQNRNNG